MMDKWIDATVFKKSVHRGASIMVGGFMACGTPETLIDWLLETDVDDLTLICNDAGYVDRGIGRLIAAGRVSRLIASHIGLNPEAGRLMGEGSLDVELVPQGTLAEVIHAGGAGLGGVLTPTGLGTVVEDGKTILDVDGSPYILEKALKADIALIEARAADNLGNLVYDKTARNFNPIMASACEKVFALVEQRVETLDPEIIITPHVFVDYLIEEVRR